MNCFVKNQSHSNEYCYEKIKKLKLSKRNTLSWFSSCKILFFRLYHSFSCLNRAISSSCWPVSSLCDPSPRLPISELRPNLFWLLFDFFSRRLTTSSSLGGSSFKFDAEPNGLPTESLSRWGGSSKGLLF